MTPQRLAESRYLVDGINSTSCAAKISRALRRLPGVLEVSVSESARVVTVVHIDDEVVPVTIEMQMRALGHKLAPITMEQARESR